MTTFFALANTALIITVTIQMFNPGKLLPRRHLRRQRHHHVPGYAPDKRLTG